MTQLHRIIYISGSGRSGSTLLERILHSSPEVASLGELHCLWRLPANQITCSCGSSLHDDPFWSPVLDRAGFDEAALAELRRLEELVCRSGFIARKNFSLEALKRDPDVRHFLDLQFRLFEACAELSGQPIIVDSSKAGPRAWILACEPRVRIVHLYRDPADVIVSWRSAKFDPGMGTAMKRMPVGAAALDWWKVEQLARSLQRVRPICRVDYRRFCEDPRAALEAIWSPLGLGATPPPAWLDANTVEPGPAYHSLNGNPDRFDRGMIEVRARQTDWTRIAAPERRVIRLAASALRTIYPPRHDHAPSSQCRKYQPNL